MEEALLAAHFQEAAVEGAIVGTEEMRGALARLLEEVVAAAALRTEEMLR